MKTTTNKGESMNTQSNYDGPMMSVVRKKTALPWYLKDKYGYPIEFQEGKGRIIRIICQNIRKITG